MLPNLFKIDDGNIINVNYLVCVYKQHNDYILHFLDKTELTVSEEEYKKVIAAIGEAKRKELLKK